MTKSRIKSDEEYKKILGESSYQQDKTISDANKYFNSIRKKDTTYSDDNPFNKTLSIKEIKQLKREKNESRDNVANIKQAIASAQTQPPDWYKEEEVSPVVTAPPKKIIRSADYSSNAQKLYENLRSGKKATPTGKVQRSTIEPTHHNAGANEEDNIEHSHSREDSRQISELREQVNHTYNQGKEGFSQEKKPYSFEYKQSDNDEYTKSLDNSMLDLTADFTRENENFVEAINQQRKIIRSEKALKESVSQEVVPDLPSDDIRLDEQSFDADITDKLDKQLEMFNPSSPQSPLMEKPIQYENKPAFNQNDIESPIIPPVTTYDSNVVFDTPSDENASEKNLGLGKSKSKYQDTLKLALDPEHTASFTDHELDLLNDNKLTGSTKPKKKTADIIITIILVIAIIVALYLLITSFM